jgi:hypothetical protein
LGEARYLVRRVVGPGRRAGRIHHLHASAPVA